MMTTAAFVLLLATLPAAAQTTDPGTACRSDEPELCFTDLLGGTAAAAAPIDFSELLAATTSPIPLNFSGLLIAGEPLHNPLREEIAAELQRCNAQTCTPEECPGCTELGTGAAPCPCDLAPTIAAGRQKLKVKTKGPVILPDTAAPPVRVEYLEMESSTSCTSGSCGKAKRGWFKRRR